MNNADKVELRLKRLYPFFIGFGSLMWTQHNDNLPIHNRPQFLAIAHRGFVNAGVNAFTCPWYDFNLRVVPSPDSVVMESSVISNRDSPTGLLQSAIDQIISGSTNLPFLTEQEFYLWAYCCGLTKAPVSETTISMITMLGLQSLHLEVELVRAQDVEGLTVAINIDINREDDRFVARGNMGRANLDLNYLLNLE